MPRTCQKDLSIQTVAGCPEFLANIPFTLSSLGGMASGETDAILSPRILFAGDLLNNKVIDRDDNSTIGTVTSLSGFGSASMIYIPSTMEVWGVSGLINYYLNAWNAKSPFAGTLSWTALGIMQHLAYHVGNNEVLTVYNDTADIRIIGHNAATKVLATNVIVSPGAALPVGPIAYSEAEVALYVPIQDAAGIVNRIDIYDSAYALIDTIALGANIPQYMTVSNFSNRLYVWLQNTITSDWELRVYDCTDNSQLSSLYPSTPDYALTMMGVDETTGKLYTGYVVGVNVTIVIIDTMTNSEICAFNHATELSTVAIGEGSRVYFTLGGSANIEIYQ